MIELKNVWQHYGVRPVLRNVDLKIASGELVAILGPNGMGKSTLMGVMAGTISPIKGTVEIDGKTRRGSVDEENEIRKQVIYVPDHPWLPQSRTGREFVLALARLYEVDEERLFDHADKLLELFDLDTHADWAISSYSNGQKHKVALCGALLCETPILMLDEAFSGGLDPAGILALKRLLRHRVEKQNATVVITTPVAELVEEVADRICVLADGEVIAFDSPANLKAEYGETETLSEALQKIMNSETMDRLDEYLEEQP